MPLVRTIQTYAHAKIGIWHISEEEAFFSKRVKIEKTVQHPHKRLQHLAARYLLTALEPDFPVDKIQIAPSNKPFVPENTFHFSLAHSGDYAAAIVSRNYRVGIDVEKISPRVERVATKFLGYKERSFIDARHYTAHLTLCWCAKESVFKWDGDGGMDFREYMHLEPFPFLPEGKIVCHFQKRNIIADLTLSYFIKEEYCVAWLVDENK